MYPKLNNPAPEFFALDQNNEEQTLKKYAGKWVLLYFYPKDDTPGCTTEACSLRDNFKEYSQAGITILGVSADSVKSHVKFAKKFSLPFVLLADEKKEIVTAYGVWQKKKFMGREYMGIARTSFLINPKGTLVKIYEKVKPAEHAAEVLEDVRNSEKNKIPL